MSATAMIRQKTVATLTRIAGRSAPGVPTTTALPRVVIWSSTRTTKPTLALFQPKFYLLLQGRKRLVIGGRTVEFGAGDCAVSSVGLPFSTQVIEASQEAPYIGFELGLNADMIGMLSDQLPSSESAAAATFATATLTEDVMDAVDRLVRLLDRSDDIPILAEQTERELCYRLLLGPMRHTLRQTAQKGTRAAKIRQSITWIRANASSSMRVADLADAAGMSLTSFHRHFKEATGCSPLAYQRFTRLLEARRLISSREAGVTAAAFATGYASASQFSREYKKLFGVSPIDAKRAATLVTQRRNVAPHDSGANMLSDVRTLDTAGLP